ncbi:MAG: efflux RND transporter periplasmic adaptor subunit [Muribaculaceae bacterium]|nr:efflux RND transporter periplasmic adaptor subunit [Muribaculaceae bacterium]
MKIKASNLTCLSVAIAALSLSSCGGQQQTQQAMVPSLAVMTVQKSDSELHHTYPATIKGKTDIDIRPQVTGFITKVHVDEGQHVRKGQVLFTLDQVQFQAAVDQAEAAVNAAKTAVSTAQLTEANKRKLLDKNIISEYEWQMAANQLEQAKAQLSQAQAALTTARKNLAYTTVTAPSDGVVGTIPNREGSLASPSSMQPLTTVSDNSDIYAYFSLNEKDILELTNGGSQSLAEAIASMPAVKLTLADGSVYPYEGKVATVSGVIDNTTGSASVRALFDNPSGMLRSGNTGQISIPVIAHDAISIPQKATFEIQDLKYVFTLNDSNRTVATPIQILPVNDGKQYIVTSGLNPGDRIVVEGIGTSVRGDMPVNPVDAAEKAAQQQAQQQQ